MSDWIDFTFWTACLIAVVVYIFDNTRLLVMIGPRKKEILMLAGLAIISIAIGASFYWMHVKSNALSLNGNPYGQLPANWSAEQPAEEREKNSKSYAAAAYLGGGVLLKHVDNTGQWVSFSPSQAQVTERESAVVNQAKWAELSAGFAKIAWTWWLSCLFAVAFGWLAARQPKNVPAKTSIDAESGSSSARDAP